MAIGTTAAIIGASALTAGVGAYSSSKASSAQSKSADNAAQVQWDMFNQTRADMEPWRASGVNALGQLEAEILPQNFDAAYDDEGGFYTVGGILDNNTGQAARFNDPRYVRQVQQNARAGNALAGNIRVRESGFETSPGYEFRRDEGLKAIDRSAAARGGLFSGATMKAAQRYGDGIAAAEYGDYINRLGMMAGTGQTATTQIGQFGAQTAGNVGNALMAGGDARASGYQNMNAAFQGGAQNALGLGARFGGWFDQ